MTVQEFNEKFDDEHQLNFYCVGVLDGEGEDDRRTARLCANINATVMNAVRLQGKPVEDRLYHNEDEYLPKHWRQNNPMRKQSWEEMRANLGW